VMNLTTVRTHQYAVWITVGFFEVKRRGDIGMIASGAPQLAFDILGPEIGVQGDGRRRYRGFFLVDRLKLDGFDPTATGRWQTAVVYRQNLL
jgi:large repetitive protein